MALGDKVVAGYMLLGAVEGPENMAEGDQLLTEMNRDKNKECATSQTCQPLIIESLETLEKNLEIL